MRAGVIQGPRTSQPQGPSAVDRANQRTRNLKGYWPANTEGGGILFDIAGTNNATLNSGVSAIPSPIGKALAFDGSTGRITFGSSAQIKTSNFTWSYWIRPRSLAKAYGALLTTVENLGQQSQTLYIKSNGKLAQYVARNDSNTANYDGTGTATLAVGNTYHIATRFNSVSGTASTFLNGAMDGSATMAVAGAIPFTSGCGTDFAFDAGVAGREIDIIAGNFAYFDTDLSDEAIRRLYLYPWELFAPIQRRIWVPVSAGAATFKAAWASGSTTIVGGGINA
jgi:hypothetical protein